MAEKSEMKFGVADLAKEMGVQDTTARIALRKHKIEKAGKAYGWNSKTELQAVAKKLKGDAAPAKKPAAKKPAAKKAKATAEAAE